MFVVKLESFLPQELELSLTFDVFNAASETFCSQRKTKQITERFHLQHIVQMPEMWLLGKRLHLSI